MEYFNRFLNIARLMSLDIVAGALVLTWSLSSFFNVELPYSVPVCLGICIWLIYTTDHLFDAFKSKKKLSIDRHVFHRTYVKPIAFISIFVLLTGIVMVFKLPEVTFNYGLILLLIVIVYFSILFFFRELYIKELTIALIYAAGIFLGPVSLSNGISLLQINLMIQLCLIALINLLLFSYLEHDADEADNHPSLVRSIGKAKSKILLNVLIILTIIIQGLTLYNYSSVEGFPEFQLLFLIMTAILFLIQQKMKYFKEKNRYRILGDGIFFIPLIWLL